jgi:hypothetical protein
MHAKDYLLTAKFEHPTCEGPLQACATTAVFGDTARSKMHAKD